MKKRLIAEVKNFNIDDVDLLSWMIDSSNAEDLCTEMAFCDKYVDDFSALDDIYRHFWKEIKSIINKYLLENFDISFEDLSENDSTELTNKALEEIEENLESIEAGWPDTIDELVEKVEEENDPYGDMKKLIDKYFDVDWEK